MKLKNIMMKLNMKMTHLTREDGLLSRNIYIVFLEFHFCVTHLEISLTSINICLIELPAMKIFKDIYINRKKTL